MHVFRAISFDYKHFDFFYPSTVSSEYIYAKNKFRMSVKYINNINIRNAYF